MTVFLICVGITALFWVGAYYNVYKKIAERLTERRVNREVVKFFRDKGIKVKMYRKAGHYEIKYDGADQSAFKNALDELINELTDKGAKVTKNTFPPSLPAPVIDLTK